MPTATLGVCGLLRAWWETERCKDRWLDKFTCRLQPAELGSSSWPARENDPSAGWGSEKSSGSAGYFLWPLTTPPDLPPDSHLDRKVQKDQQKQSERAGAEEAILLSFRAALLPHLNSARLFITIYRTVMKKDAAWCASQINSKYKFAG